MKQINHFNEYRRTLVFSNRLRGESHPRSKLTSEQVLQIRDLYKQGFSTNVIARNFKVSKWNVEEIVKKKTWTHI